MNQSIPPKPPFLSNSLRMPDEEGLYLFLVDTLVVPSGQGGEVRKHEVAHRALSHVSMGNTTFGVIRDLVGMSYVLLWMAVSNAFYNKVSIQGNKFGELHISGGTPTARTEIETLFSRVEYIEHFIDQAWTRLEPIAEMAAIDFSEGVGDEERSWILSRATELPSQQPASTIEKDRLFKAVIEHFGIYKEALWKAWTEYQKIKSDLARKELLRVCMSLLYLEDDVGIHVKDPIEIMLNRAPFAQQQEESARYMFFMERTSISILATGLIEFIREQVFDGVDSGPQAIRELIGELSNLVQKQFQEEHKFIETPFGPREVVIEPPSQIETGAGQSFLRFEWNTQGDAKVHVNPFFITTKLKTAAGHPFPQEWWRWLILMEKIRDALKTGQPIVCPFQGWKIECQDKQEEARCGDECFIRRWIERAGCQIGLATNEGLCAVSN